MDQLKALDIDPELNRDDYEPFDFRKSFRGMYSILMDGMLKTDPSERFEIRECLQTLGLPCGIGDKENIGYPVWSDEMPSKYLEAKRLMMIKLEFFAKAAYGSFQTDSHVLETTEKIMKQFFSVLPNQEDEQVKCKTNLYLLCCYWIACKICDERYYRIPKLLEILDLCFFEIWSEDSVRDAEREILQLLNFRIYNPF